MEMDRIRCIDRSPSPHQYPLWLLCISPRRKVRKIDFFPSKSASISPSLYFIVGGAQERKHGKFRGQRTFSIQSPLWQCLVGIWEQGNSLKCGGGVTLVTLATRAQPAAFLKSETTPVVVCAVGSEDTVCVAVSLFLPQIWGSAAVQSGERVGCWLSRGEILAYLV